MLTMNFADQSPRPPAAPPSDPPPEESGGEGEQEQHRTVREEISGALVKLLPWGLSIVLHAVVVVLAGLAVWTTVGHFQKQKVVVPYVKLSDAPGAPLKMRQTQRLKAPSTHRREIKSADRAEAEALRRPVATHTPLIGVKGAEGAKPAPFGTAMGGGARFQATFFGSQGNARRVVFVVDATGSLIDTLPQVLDELQNTIARLSPHQKFTVIFFRGGNVPGKRLIETPPQGLKAATSDIKKTVIGWIDPKRHHVEAGGKANPVAALRRALGYQPDLIFLLSDNITGAGRYALKQEELLRKIQQANTSHTRINTLQFVYQNPLGRRGGEGTMKRIAEQTGGLYKFISAADLKLHNAAAP